MEERCEQPKLANIECSQENAEVFEPISDFIMSATVARFDVGAIRIC